VVLVVLVAEQVAVKVRCMLEVLVTPQLQIHHKEITAVLIQEELTILRLAVVVQVQ
jgi:hypothetical protein